MKFSTIAALTISLAGFYLTANAATPDNIAVYSTEKSNGSISVGGKSGYTKSFEIAVVNLSEKDVDLSKLCLKAFSPDSKEFTLDTINEVLTKGILKTGDSVQGVAMFGSKNDAVHKSALIKISDDCKYDKN